MQKIIGIVGGVGPYAGLDLTRKIFDQTVARRDQEHVSVILWSTPDEIGDRSEYVLGRSSINPATGIAAIVRRMEAAGASHAAIACNTAHAPPIFDVITRILRDSGSRIELVNMVEQVVRFVRQHHPAVAAVGVLATDGTMRSNVYTAGFARAGIKVLYPDAEVQARKVLPAIYDVDYGIKAKSEQVTVRARTDLLDAAAHLFAKGAQALVLGCTELPLAIKAAEIGGRTVIDPTLVLARALVGRVAPERLKPLATATEPA